jgi:hypothetical protein
MRCIDRQRPCFFLPGQEGHDAHVAAEIAGVVEANAQRCAAVVVFREPSAAVRDKVAAVTRSKHYRSIFSLVRGLSLCTAHPSGLAYDLAPLCRAFCSRSCVVDATFCMARQGNLMCVSVVGRGDQGCCGSTADQHGPAGMLNVHAPPQLGMTGAVYGS